MENGLSSSEPGKTCTKCQQLKSPDQYYVRNRQTGELFSCCKQCWNESRKQRYRSNLDESRRAGRESSRKKYQDDPEAGRAATQKWREKNREAEREIQRRSDAKRRAKKKAWAKEHPEEAKAKRKAYREKHRATFVASGKRYRERHGQEKLNNRYKQWCKNNPEAAKAIRRRYKSTHKVEINRATHKRRYRLACAAGIYDVKEWMALKELCGYRCLRCGRSELELKELLATDHIVPDSKGGGMTIANLQPLCRECNSAKGTSFIDFRPTWIRLIVESGLLLADQATPSSGPGIIAKATVRAKREHWEKMTPAQLEEYARLVVRCYRQHGYPFQRLTASQKEKHLVWLLNYRDKMHVTDGVIPSTMHSMSLCWHYFPHALAVRCHGRPSVLEIFEDDELFLQSIKNRLRRGTYISDAGIRKALKACSKAQAVSNFRPTAALAVYRRYAAGRRLDTWDMSGGYGGRLLGAWASGCVGRYVATEPARYTHGGLVRMHTDLAGLKLLPDMEACFHQIGSEDFEPEQGSLDLCFTSPPYYNTEAYSDEPSQAQLRFPVYADWLEKFLGKTLANCHRGLRPDGLLAVNVANVKGAPALADDFIRLALRQGFVEVERLRLSLSHITKGGYKHEPVFVLAKGDAGVTLWRERCTAT